MKLKQLYELKLLDYRLNGIRERPDRLLAMLLLPEKDTFETPISAAGPFYEFYGEQIQGKMNQVMEDFELSGADITNYIEEFGATSNDFEHDKIWIVFSEGFAVLQWALVYRKNQSPEEIYKEFFHNNDLETLNEFMIRYRKLYDACKEYPRVQLQANMPPFSIENNWETVAEGGFIEKYCLSEEQRERLHELRKKR